MPTDVSSVRKPNRWARDVVIALLFGLGIEVVVFLLVGRNPHVPNLQWRGDEIAVFLLSSPLASEGHIYPFRTLVEILINSLPFSICILYFIRLWRLFSLWLATPRS